MSDPSVSSTRPARLLAVDDNPLDVELISAELRRSGVAFQLEHADGRAAFERGLTHDPELILTDFTMPSFGAMDVLDLVRERNIDVPVIIISGSIGEDQAVAAMKHGALDYLLKDRLQRLGKAVERALEHRSLRRARREAEAAHARLVSVVEGSPDPKIIVDEAGRLLYLNESARQLAGIPAEQLLEELGPANCMPAEVAALVVPIASTTASLAVHRGEALLPRTNGRPIPLAYSVVAHRGAVGTPAYYAITLRDLTSSKAAEERIAALLRITRRLSSTLERDALLDELVNEALQLVGAEGGCAGVRQGDRMVSRVYQTREGRIRFEQDWAAGQGLPGWVLAHHAPYVTNDAPNDPISDDKLDERFHVRQALCLPMLDHLGQVQGFFEVHNKRSGCFEAGDVELMQAVARSAAVALTNALAYQQVQEGQQQVARYAAGLREIVDLQQAINVPDLTMDTLMAFLLSRLGRLVEADGAVIEFLEGDEMVYRAATGTAAGQIGQRLKAAASLSGRCVQEGKTLICTDAESDARVDLAACRRVGLRSMIVVPLPAGGGIQGVLKVYSARPAAFTEGDRQLLEILSGLLGSSLLRKRAEEGLVRQERDFRTLFASNPLPVCVYDRETLRILAVNDAAVNHYGYTREEFLAQDITYFNSPEELPRVRELVHSASGTDRVQGLFRHRRKDGRTMLMEVTTDAIDFQGRPARIVLANDVTRQMADAARIAEQARLLDLTSDAIIVRNLDNRVEFWNAGAERLYGWPQAEALGKPVIELIYRDPKGFEDALAATTAAGQWQGELQQVTRDGSPLTVASRWTLVRDEAGAPRSILVINTDVTNQKKVEQQFLRAQRMESIGTLAGGIAHDLNNVLAPILMSIQLLRTIATDERSRRMLETIETCTNRGARLIRQVLTFARGAQGERTTVQLKHLVHDMEHIIRETFPKNITLETTLANDVWMVRADPSQLHQVLLNLCVNARDAMPSGGRLTIDLKNQLVDEHYAAQSATHKAGRYVRLQVIDSGTGIPREILDRIFEPFFTTKGVGQGTGIGLATVQAIVKSHEGTINVYSEPGHGTTFKLYLPASEATTVTDLDERKTEIPRGAGEGVLLADDESSVLAITQQTLEAFGYRVFAAGNGAEAVALLAQNRPAIQLLITDMMMPVMDGLATIEAAKAINPKIAIIATSGLNANSHVARASKSGVHHFLAKPYDARHLLQTVHTALHESAGQN